MKIMTVRQPWASAIISLGKNVENRTRNIAGAYRGPVAIHSAARHPSQEEYAAASKFIAERSGYLPLFTTPDGLGVILGCVDLVGVHHGYAKHGEGEPCSLWAEDGTWHLELANPRRLREPIPFKGALGRRTLDDETARAVMSRLDGAA